MKFRITIAFRIWVGFGIIIVTLIISVFLGSTKLNYIKSKSRLGEDRPRTRSLLITPLNLDEELE